MSRYRASMDRRTFFGMIGLAVLAAPIAAEAQPASRVYWIGELYGSTRTATTGIREAFEQRLRELGYVEGRNVHFERRFADGDDSRMARLVREILASKIDVFYAPTGAGAKAAIEASATIPIVFAVVGDPVSVGLVQDLAKPGKNATGLTTINRDLTGKRFELLRDMLPTMSRLAILFDSTPRESPLERKEQERVARVLGWQLKFLDAPSREQYESGVTAAADWHAEAFYVSPSAKCFGDRQPIVDAISRVRRPAVYALSEFVTDGGLMSYAVDMHDQHRRAATYVDRILKGAKPADLPVEQPTRVELVINMKTAKALGLTIPPSLLLRADRLIE